LPVSKDASHDLLASAPPVGRRSGVWPNRGGKTKTFLRRKTRVPAWGLGAPPVGRPRTIKNSAERRLNSGWWSARGRRE
jgi:hypothetical protein